MALDLQVPRKLQRQLLRQLPPEQSSWPGNLQHTQCQLIGKSVTHFQHRWCQSRSCIFGLQASTS